MILIINHGPVKCAKVCDKSVVILVNTAYMQTVIYKLESFIFSSKVGPLDFHTYWKGYHNGVNSFLKENSLLYSDSIQMTICVFQYSTTSDHFFTNCMFIFHKTEVQTVILRCLMSLNLNWFKSYDTKYK